MIKSLFSILILLLALSRNTPAEANVPPENPVYHPGYISMRTSLNLFLPVSLKDAETNLKAGVLSTASQAFLLRVHQHPDELADYVGFLQSDQEGRGILLARYQADDKISPTLVNEFKLGVLAYYLYGEGLHLQDPRSKEQILLAEIARKKLQKAYYMSHAPLIGFILCDALAYTPGNSNPIPIFEDMLKHVGGASVYEKYASAKDASWAVRPPTSPGLSKNDMLILARIVINLWSQNSETEGTVEEKMIDGTRHIIIGPGMYTQEQQNAMAYLLSWQQELLKSAASQL